MSVKIFAVTTLLVLGTAAGHAYAQAGSGASAPATITAPTPSGDTARNATLGDPGKPAIRPRRTARRPIPSDQNGSTPNRASAAGGGR